MKCEKDCALSEKYRIYLSDNLKKCSLFVFIRETVKTIRKTCDQ